MKKKMVKVQREVHAAARAVQTGTKRLLENKDSSPESAMSLVQILFDVIEHYK